MNIVSGQYKGRNIKCPPGRIRPTTSRMRKSLFARLAPLEGKVFLDLFSGSGITAIEALSCYAQRVVLVENDRKKYPVLHENCASFNKEVLTIYRGSVERFIKQWNEHFDIIFADPPFAYPKKTWLIASLAESPLCGPDCVIILHHPGKEIPVISSATCIMQQSFGTAKLSFYTPIHQGSNGRSRSGTS